MCEVLFNISNLPRDKLPASSFVHEDLKIIIMQFIHTIYVYLFILYKYIHIVYFITHNIYGVLFLVALGFKVGALYLQSKHSTT
jgi:hypothetical protein